MTTDDRNDADAPDDFGGLEGVVADAFARRGEMIPTTTEEVRAAEDGVEAGVELPASLREWNAASAPRSLGSEDTARAPRSSAPRLHRPVRLRPTWRSSSTICASASFRAR